MGSLASRPKPPSQPQIVYVQQPVSQPQTPTSSGDSAATPDPEELAAQARTQNLLGRERSRFGTILTGFRGLLQQIEDAPQRKTLLGE